jgi:serine/threonine-protein kinase
LAFVASPALAEGGSNAAAEALFQDGRALFRAGKFAEACPKLAESQRLDPATGTLLALALCHEQQEKLASAWAEFTDVEARARREGRKDRVEVAREHATSLKPRLSTWVIEVPAEVAQIPGLEVRIDGAVSGAGSFGAAVPIDGGEHLVEASAPGRTPFRKAFNVKAEGDSLRVTIPVLSEERTSSPGPTEPTSRESPPANEASPETPEAPNTRQGANGGGMRVAGLVSGGVGVLAVGAGGVIALLAKSSYDKAKKQCTDSGCGDGPYEDIEDARGRGTLATVLMVAGGAALATGATLWLLAPRSREESSTGDAGFRLDRFGVGAGRAVVGGSF